MLLIKDPDTKLLICVGCSGNGIQIGQFVQFQPSLMTAITLSIATIVDTTALGLQALDISPIDFKDYTDPEAKMSIDQFGIRKRSEYGSNTYHTAPFVYIYYFNGFDIRIDYQAYSPHDSIQDEWKDTIPNC